MIGYSLLGKQGALGNQLWEIAGTYGVARSKNTVPVFPRWFYQPYFNVNQEFFGGTSRVVDDLGEDYLQDLRYWHPHYSDAVRAMFSESTLSEELLNDAYHDIDWENCISVHVRRGNNLTDRYRNHHPSPSLDYFEEALDRLYANHPMVVLSDDPSWCKKQSLFRNAIFGCGPPKGVDILELTKYEPRPSISAALDLLTIARCRKGAVISNSSFSWWGAYLSRSDRVIYPSTWYGPALAHIDTRCMFDGLGWTKI